MVIIATYFFSAQDSKEITSHRTSKGKALPNSRKGVSIVHIETLQITDKTQFQQLL